MNERFHPFEEDDLDPEQLQLVDRLVEEYRHHMRHQPGRVARRKPIEEITQEFRGTLSWLLVEDIEAASDKTVGHSQEAILDHSAYDIEDTFFIVYEQLAGRRNVMVEDIIHEHKETNLRDWRDEKTKRAADFLIQHGADENEIFKWKGVEGSARQQRAMRRMYWLLDEPYMQQFKEFLKGRATTEQPYKFADLATVVKTIILEGQQNNLTELARSDSLIPRKKEELAETSLWLERALNICEHVFDKDIQNGVYGA